MIKILHTADIHLDSPLRSLALRDPALRERVQTATRTALTRIVDAALTERAQAVLISGDLFDGAERSARTAAFLTQELDRLRACDVRVFYIKGNHDAENPITGHLTLPDNVHVFDGRGAKVQLAEGVWIHGVSFASRHAPDSLLPRFPAPVAAAVNIAMLHTSLAGAAGHDPYAPCTVAELAGMGFDYWALGHVHRRQIHAENPWIVMPGMPQGRDIGEAGPKSATLITVGEAITVKEVPVSAVEFLDIAVDVAGAASDDILRDRVRGAVNAAAQALLSDTGVVRLTLQGATPRRWQILRDRDVWAETADRIAQETGRLWLEKLRTDLSDPTEAGQGATDELARLMDEIRRESGFDASCRDMLDALLGELPPARRAALLPDEDAADALVQKLAGRGAARIVARMKGAGG
ncbi:MAG: DNA repair exonuclease [Pseudomonadota bacterium]